MAKAAIHNIPVVFLTLIAVDLSCFSQGKASIDCSKGFYKFTFQDGNTTCRTCKTCPAGSEVKMNCTSQSDTVCRSCAPGTFSGGSYKCRNCSHCPPGTFVAGYCSLTSDTRCEPCAEGTYSSEWSVRYCSRCSRCSRLETVLQNCSKTGNYKCGDCIQGYYKHPNLPMCIRCSYCYPDYPGATYKVPECATKSDDPSMQCIPIPGVARSAGSDDSNTRLIPTSTITEKSVSIFTRTDNQDTALIPPHISIPIIIVCVVVTVLMITFIFIYKRRNRKSKSSFPVFSTSLFTRKQTSADGNERKRHSDSSNEIVMVHTVSDTSGRSSGSRAESFLSGLPTDSCEQTALQETGPDHTALPLIHSRACQTDVDDELHSSNCFEDRRMFPVSTLQIIHGPSDQKELQREAQVKSCMNNEVNCDVKAEHRTSYCAENQAFEDDTGDLGSRAYLPIDVPMDENTQTLTRNVILTLDTTRRQNVTSDTSERPAVLSRTKKYAKSELQTSHPLPYSLFPKPLNVPALANESHDCRTGTDNEDSSSSSAKSTMSSDYDSDIVVSNTLLDRGRAQVTSAGETGGKGKRRRKKSRRQSHQGISVPWGENDSAKQLYSRIGTFSV